MTVKKYICFVGGKPSYSTAVEPSNVLYVTVEGQNGWLVDIVADAFWVKSTGKKEVDSQKRLFDDRLAAGNGAADSKGRNCSQTGEELPF